MSHYVIFFLDFIISIYVAPIQLCAHIPFNKTIKAHHSFLERTKGRHYSSMMHPEADSFEKQYNISNKQQNDSFQIFL